MKCRMEKAELVRILGVAERAITGKSSLPVLSALLLEVAADRIKATGTDLEMTLVAEGGCVSTEDGLIAVTAKTCFDVVRGLKDGEINLSSDETHLTVTSGRSRYKVPLWAAAEYPVLPEATPTATFTVSEQAFASLLQRVLPATATDDTRPMLCGTLWEMEENSPFLTVTATDTHRMHRGRLDLEHNAGRMSIIVGARFLREALRFLNGEGCATVHVDAKAGMIIIEAAGGAFTARLIEGNYPKVEKVIPDHPDHTAVDRRELADALKRASVVAKEADGRVVLEISDAGSVSITAAGQTGEADEAVDCNNHGLVPDRIAFNWNYLREAVLACPDEELQFYKGEALRPALFCGKSREEFLSVVMPMTLH